LRPLTTVGIAVVRTNAPAGVYSSMNTGFPVFARAIVPSPTR